MCVAIWELDSLPLFNLNAIKAASNCTLIVPEILVTSELYLSAKVAQFLCTALTVPNWYIIGI
jgi:hypothetical protein